MSDGDSDSNWAVEEILRLSETSAPADPRDYFVTGTVARAYESALYSIRLGGRSVRASAVRRVLTRHRASISALVDPLFTDIHALFFRSEFPADSKPARPLAACWNACYADIYTGLRTKAHIDDVLDVLPYVLAYSVLEVYIGIPVPLGIVPPMRIDVARRTVFLVSSLMPLDSHIDAEMTRLFGAEEVLAPVARVPPPPPVLLPLEDLSGLVDLERRPRPVVRPFDTEARSPISRRKARAHVEVAFLYPVNGERTFHEDLRTFSRGTGDRETKSLLLRARSRDVRAALNHMQMKAAVERTRTIHRFQQDRAMIETKRHAVISANDAAHKTFMRELADNYAKGISREDPRVTLDLLRQRERQTEGNPQPRKKENVESIVDAVLRLCALEERHRDPVILSVPYHFAGTVLGARPKE